MPPKGRGRKSNIEAYRDAMAIVKLVDHDCMEVADAAKALGLTLRTAYRLLSRARGLLLTPQIEADKKAAEPKVNQWFETALSPEPSQAPSPVEDGTVVVPATPVAVPPQVPTPEPQTERTTVESEPEPWPWGHLMSREEFLTRDPWRQKQLLEQWEENIALGGVWTPVLRGGPKNRTCFRGCPSYQCLCEDNL